jgi:hypothetical protein
MPRRSTRRLTRPNSSAPATAAAPVAARDATPTWLRPAILVFTGVLLLAWFAIPATDSDSWWHLKTGQFIVERHALPIPDPFAFTTYLQPPLSHGEALARDFNLTHSWLGQVIFYLAYAAAGFPGVILLRALLLSGFAALVGWIVFHRSGGLYRAIAASIAASGVAMFSTSDRPFLFTYFLLALTMAVLEYRRALWVLIPLFVIWPNLHAGFFMGWVVVGCYCAESLYQRVRGKPRADERRLWVVSVVSIMATGLNPNGFRFLEVLLAYRNSPMQAQLLEWQHPRFWEPSWYTLVLWGGLLALIFARSKARPADWLLFVLFAAASLQAVRNVTLMALIGPIVIFSYAGSSMIVRRAVEFAALAVLIGGLAYQIGYRRAFQLRAEMWPYPSGAADFLLSHHITGRLFNTYEQGGYWIWRLWPQNRVFIDGRALNETVYRDYMRIAFNADSVGGPSGEELLRRYGIDIIAMNCFQIGNGDVYLLPAALADPSQKEWKLVYHDAQAVIFMRNPPAGVPVLNSLEALGSMDEQCNTTLDHTPWQPGCARSLGLLYSRIGGTSNAVRWLATYRQYVSRPDTEVDAILRRR